MTHKTTFKYSIGDKVKFTGNWMAAGDAISYRAPMWREIPEKDNVFEIEVLRMIVDETGIRNMYCFHAYCNEYFDFHGFVDEKYIEPIGEAHSYTAELDTIDAFKNEIKIGDMVYRGVYHSTSWNGEHFGDKEFVKCKATDWCLDRGYVKSFDLTIGDTYYGGRPKVNFKCLRDDIEVRKELIHNVYASDHVCHEDLRNVIVKFPDTFIEDVAEHLLEEYKRYSCELSWMDQELKRVVNLLEIRGCKDEVLARFEELKSAHDAKVMKNKEYRERCKAKKSGKTAKKSDFDASAFLSSLTAEQKAALLAELNK